ncbi:ADP-ribosylation factor 1-like [Cryptomeria japonica]|uniref:ADP-ribosylation factor 1-like n=1 Tax=Cryptomeria japonica TaxID=3369 RepID=UPI0025AC30E5|nr:ADP-ribosylation factor 1-like [Cryptomeria japonica]
MPPKENDEINRKVQELLVKVLIIESLSLCAIIVVLAPTKGGDCINKRGKLSENIRPLWKEYIGHSKGVIFVVDSDDRERISEAKDVLHNFLKEKEFRDAAVAVFANKNDFPNAMSVLEITEELEMSSLTQRHWHVQSSCATSGDGLYEGLDWLSNNV